METVKTIAKELESIGYEVVKATSFRRWHIKKDGKFIKSMLSRNDFFFQARQILNQNLEKENQDG